MSTNPAPEDAKNRLANNPSQRLTLYPETLHLPLSLRTLSSLGQYTLFSSIPLTCLPASPKHLLSHPFLWLTFFASSTHLHKSRLSLNPRPEIENLIIQRPIVQIHAHAHKVGTDASRQIGYRVVGKEVGISVGPLELEGCAEDVDVLMGGMDEGVTEAGPKVDGRGGSAKGDWGIS